MITAFSLTLLGLIFIFCEFFLPSIVAAVIGAILSLMGLIFFMLQGKGWIWNLTYLTVTALAVFLTCKFALWQIKRSRRFFLNDDQKGFSASEFSSELIGKMGVADCDMRPAGFVTVEGQRLQALAQEGYLPKGTEILVVSGKGAHLIVKKGAL